MGNHRKSRSDVQLRKQCQLGSLIATRRYNAGMLNSLVDEIISDEVLDLAYQWLCHRRKYYSHNQDIWEVR
jgi:hypothetical protein